MCNKTRRKYRKKRLETVAVDSVYCLSWSETWRYKLAETEKLYFVAGVRMVGYCNKTK